MQTNQALPKDPVAFGPQRIGAPTPVTFGDANFLLCPSGVLMWPARNTLVVSDLHLEKGSYFARRGIPVSVLDSLDTLARLAAAIDHHKPERVISLGDSFHDRRAGERMARPDGDHLASLVESVDDWTWVTGNHDGELGGVFGGHVVHSLSECGILFAHEDEDVPCSQIIGHYHPKVRVPLKGRVAAGPCFAVGEKRLVMPAFGSYTGGLAIDDEAFIPVFGDGAVRVWMMYRAKLWRIK
ncbi:MAG: ligase-associated DNA damage response endonuclease PdeM [Pseudomonadota bacterium]